MNTYRVDRVNSRRVPCGMNSIRYIGDNAKPFESFEAADVQLLNKKRELDRLDAYVDRDYVIQFKPCGGQYASSTS